MESARSLDDVTSFWQSTNNTLGINHGFGSSADKQFMALETNAAYTAYFRANDSREADHVVNGTHYGFPIAEALWRSVVPETMGTKPPLALLCKLATAAEWRNIFSVAF